MKTRTGYETDGTYLKFKSGFTSLWCVETEKEMQLFHSEKEADEYIKNLKKIANKAIWH